MQVIALCSIQGSAKKGEANIEPGTVFTATGDKLKLLQSANAVREPSDDEVALAKHRGKLLTPKGETAEPTEAETAAAEKAAAKAAADADKAAKAAAKKQATAASTAKVADAAAGTTATENGASTSAPANDLGV